jgi:myosin-5
VLDSNPILEAFGNARTVRNDNSSRFGKFIELQFKQSGSLIGASIETYLLEKVRLIHQNPGERNFHIFYELLAAATAEERECYHLSDMKAKDFKLTSASGTFDRRDGADDSELFDTLVLAMGTMGFEPQTQEDIFAVTVAFLHASNVTFKAITDDSSSVDETNPSLAPMLKLLGLDFKEFQSAMCEFEIETGIDSYRRQVNQELAVKGLEAFIKGTYGAMFAFIVQTINKKIDFKPAKGTPSLSAKAASISVLDIFGFESLATNSFEQLCINYCNETLQQQFNLFIFKAEQEEYKREGMSK